MGVCWSHVFLLGRNTLKASGAPVMYITCWGNPVLEVQSCYKGRINTKDRTIYVDFTVKLPIRFMDGMVEIFIIYDWTTNEILATPVKNMAEETIVSCFKRKITYLYKMKIQTHSQHHWQCGVKSSTSVPRGREGKHTTCGAAQP